MKEETKKLVQWINTILNDHKRMLKGVSTIQVADAYDEKRKAAMKFLDSLPEIESHLCRGGYIQDKNGTPCCDGDKVMYKSKEYTLQWSRPYSKFFLKADKSVRDVWTFGRNEISKVEE